MTLQKGTLEKRYDKTEKFYTNKRYKTSFYNGENITLSDNKTRLLGKKYLKIE